MLNIFKKQTPEQKQAFADWQNKFESDLVVKKFELDKDKPQILLECNWRWSDEGNIEELNRALNIAMTKFDYIPVGDIQCRDDSIFGTTYYQTIQKKGLTSEG